MISLRAVLLVALTASAQSSKVSPVSSAIEFVKIPPGEFLMGCVDGDKDCLEDEVPRHRVRLTKGFEIGRYEVTQAQWEGVMDSNPSENKGAKLPVDSVNKADVHAFLDKLNERRDGYTYRLPTEAEWEYAARADAPDPPRASLGDYAWFADNSDDESHPVGLKKPNAWGLYDMLGNVREWVDDRAAYYDYEPLPEVSVDPKGPQGRGFGGRRGRAATAPPVHPKDSTSGGDCSSTGAAPKGSRSFAAAVGIISHLTCVSRRATTITGPI